MDTKEKQTPSGLKIAIIVLSVLLVLSAGGLAARYIYLAYFSPVQSSASVSEMIMPLPLRQLLIWKLMI